MGGGLPPSTTAAILLGSQQSFIFFVGGGKHLATPTFQDHNLSNMFCYYSTEVEYLGTLFLKLVTQLISYYIAHIKLYIVLQNSGGGGGGGLWLGVGNPRAPPPPPLYETLLSVVKPPNSEKACNVYSCLYQISNVNSKPSLTTI